MATVNLTRTKRFNEKRDISVFAARIRAEDIPVSGDTYQLFILPANSLIIDNQATVITPFDSDEANVDIGFDGGAELMSAGDFTSAAGSTVSGVANTKWRPTGGTVTLSPTYDETTDPLTGGDVLVRIHYVEIEKVTGHLTRYLG